MTAPPFATPHECWLWCCRAPEKLAAETHAAVMALIDRGELWPRHRRALALVHLYGRAPRATDPNERGVIPFPIALYRGPGQGGKHLSEKRGVKMKDWQVHVALARRERAMAIASFGRAIRHWWREKMVQWFGVKSPIPETRRVPASPGSAAPTARIYDLGPVRREDPHR